jgi:hypothetical protein
VRTKPKVGDVVKSRGEWAEDGAGYIIATEGIHVWVRYFDTAAKGESWDVYHRRDKLEIISRGKN